MKALLTALFLSGGSLLAADVQVTVHAVELPQAKLAELLSEGLGGDELFAKVRAEVASGKAHATDTSLLRVRTEEKGEIESIVEVISPTEYDPPTFAAPAVPAPAAPLPPPDVRLADYFTSFETRNVGMTFSVEPMASLAVADVHLTWEWVTESTPFEFNSWHDELGRSYRSPRGHYNCLKAPADLTLADGKWTLVSALAARKSDGSVDFSRKVAVFAKADVLKIE